MWCSCRAPECIFFFSVCFLTVTRQQTTVETTNQWSVLLTMVRDKKILFASCLCRQTRAIFAVGSLRLFPFWECQSIIFSQHSYPQTLFIIYHSTMTDLRKPTLIESIALGGASCVFTGTFSEETSPIFPHIFPRRHKEHWAAISRIFLSHYHYTLCCNSEFHASH